MSTTNSINPYNGERIKVFHNHSEEEVEEIIDKAHKRFLSWKHTSFADRRKLMLAVASELKKNKREYAETMVLEMGKPITQAISEIEKCAWVCEYYAENAENFLKREFAETDADRSYVCFQPIGVVLAVMPWNFPYWQVFRFAAPALMAGNIAVLKHASNVFGCAENIEKIFKNAGFPDHCFSTLLVGSDMVQSIIENDKIAAVTLTGSGPAGASVASIAGKNIKKSVLELGGSNALIVLKDCDIPEAIKTCIDARYLNNGQSCIAGKRLIIDKSIADSFLKQLKKQVKALKIGDPMEQDTFISVMARADLAEKLKEQMDNSLAMGAKLLLGGKQDKAFFEPTILTNVTPEMEVFKEETFGPLLTVTTFTDIEEAIALSNNSIFGLGVSVFTKDIKMVEQLATEFDEGAVFVNELVKSDPRLPFGGIKKSGYGRELSGYGIREFVNKKTIFINRFHF